MKNVWRELQKRTRLKYESTEAFLHPATAEENWSTRVRMQIRRSQLLGDQGHTHEARKWEVFARMSKFVEVTMSLSPLDARENSSIQDRALAFFFHEALMLAQRRIRPVPVIEAKLKRRHFLTMASRIHADAKHHSSDELRDAAFAYEVLADKSAPPQGDPLLVARKRSGDEHQNAFVIMLAATAAAIFGSPLYGIVATVTNVMFKSDRWTDQRVRKLAGHTLPLTS
jgi:hypothetical protein